MLQGCNLAQFAATAESVTCFCLWCLEDSYFHLQNGNGTVWESCWVCGRCMPRSWWNPAKLASYYTHLSIARCCGFSGTWWIGSLPHFREIECNARSSFQASREICLTWVPFFSTKKRFHQMPFQESWPAGHSRSTRMGSKGSMQCAWQVKRWL